MKMRQSAKIREIAQALASAGIVELDEQAQALGLARSTTWTILRAVHKSTGISPAIVARMLASPALPSPARSAIIEYVEEKSAGLYGHSKAQRCRFIAGLAVKLAERRHRETVGPPAKIGFLEDPSGRSVIHDASIAIGKNGNR